MKKLLAIFLVCALLTGYQTTIQAAPRYNDENKIPYPAGTVLERYSGEDRKADVPNSPYYPRLDFYNMKTGGGLTIIENFKTIQQTSELTCAPACVIMVLEHYGRYSGQKDTELYELRENKGGPESTLKDLMRMFESAGEWDFYSTYDLADPDEIPKFLITDSLKKNRPIIVGDNEWGVGHWRIIIGYDDMGDDLEANDVLILVDPYDSTDHNQDGYTVVPFQRLYYNWRSEFDPDFKRNLFLIATPR
jgi:hypothetical protein